MASSAIERLDAAFLDIMKRADELGLDGRISAIGPVIEETFDLAFMARAALGRAWEDLSAADRERWVETFSKYTIWRLADRFSAYSGQSFVIEGHRPASRQTLIVETRLIRPSQDDVSLHYRMREKDAGWKVVDVYAKGTISEVAMRRAEYAEVLRAGGFEHLITSVSALVTKASDLARR